MCSVQAICSFSFLPDKVTNCSHCGFHYNWIFLLYLIWLSIEQLLNFPACCYGHQKGTLHSEAGLSRGVSTVSLLLLSIPTGVTKDHSSSFGHSTTWGLIFSSLSTATLQAFPSFPGERFITQKWEQKQVVCITLHLVGLMWVVLDSPPIGKVTASHAPYLYNCSYITFILYLKYSIIKSSLSTGLITMDLFSFLQVKKSSLKQPQLKKNPLVTLKVIVHLYGVCSGHSAEF